MKTFICVNCLISFDIGDNDSRIRITDEFQNGAGGGWGDCDTVRQPKLHRVRYSVPCRCGQVAEYHGEPNTDFTTHWPDAMDAYRGEGWVEPLYLGSSIEHHDDHVRIVAHYRDADGKYSRGGAARGPIRHLGAIT